MKIDKVIDVPMADIERLGANVRSDLTSVNSQEALLELAVSIEENGLMQPIVLRGIYGSPPYDVIVGQRRYLAHEYLKENTIKAVFAGDISDIQALVLSLSENLLRQEMNHADIARAVTTLYEEFDKDERQVQKKLGLSIRAIRNYLVVDAQATPKIKQLLDSHQISPTDAKRVILASQGDNNKADALADELVGLTRHDKSRLVDAANSNPKASAKEIVEKARKPKIEESIKLTLSFRVSQALRIAVDSLQLESEEIITNALTSWLVTNDFLNLSK